MKRFDFNDKLQDKITTITAWCDNKFLIDEILTTGHADVHYRGSTALPRSMNDAIDTLYSREDWSNIMPDNPTLVAQIVRVAKDTIPASHFADKTTMMAAFSETMSACAGDIAQWVSKDKGNHTSRLRLTVDTGAFIGTGIGLDGNEYATTSATIILRRRPTASIEVGRIPFSVVTIYPDITGKHGVGTLEATGRCYGPYLARAINTQGVGAKMYWQLKEAGQPCFYDRRGNGAAIIYASTETINQSINPDINQPISKDVTAMLRYNEHSSFQGQILVNSEEKEGWVALRTATHLTQDEKNTIRAFEKQFHPMLENAIKDAHATIAENSPMLAPIAPGPILENGDYRNVVEEGEWAIS